MIPHQDLRRQHCDSDTGKKNSKILLARNLEGMLYVLQVSMKTCLNISATNWPAMRAAKATRHSRCYQGYVFSLGLSLASIGKQTEGNLDRLAVGR
jgi:hypothetical protein